MLQDEILSFGRRLGLEGLSLGERGVAALEIENVGTLTLEMGEGSAEDSLLMTLAAPPRPEDAAQRYRLALERLDWRRGGPAIAAGLHRGRLILCARLPAASLSEADLDRALRALMENMSALG